MNLTPSQLQAQRDRALATWPFIPDVEQVYNLPLGLLLAVGSRETNLTNERGDTAHGPPDPGGRGHGVWQLDDGGGSRPVPPGFDANVRQQAEIAAQMLAGLISHFKGDLLKAVCGYNAGAGGVERVLRKGQSPNMATTGHDYGDDVLARLGFIQKIGAGAPSSGGKTKVFPSPSIAGCPGPRPGTWLALHPDGGVEFQGFDFAHESFPDYTVMANDADTNLSQAYGFGPHRNNGEQSYPGLPAESRKGNRTFVAIWLG